MSILPEAPLGGLVEKIDGKSRELILNNVEIERFEDAHRGIFEVWDAFMGEAKGVTSTECRDLVTLGLIGGGMKDNVAVDLIKGQGPSQLHTLRTIAQSLVGVAFAPEVAEVGDDPAPDAGDDKKKEVTPPVRGA